MIVPGSNVEKYRDEAEVVGCQRQTLLMSAASVAETSGMPGKGSGRLCYTTVITAWNILEISQLEKRVSYL